MACCTDDRTQSRRCQQSPRSSESLQVSARPLYAGLVAAQRVRDGSRRVYQPLAVSRVDFAVQRLHAFGVLAEPFEQAALGLGHLAVAVRPQVRPIVVDCGSVRQPSQRSEWLRYVRRNRSLAVAGAAQQREHVALLLVVDAERVPDQHARAPKLLGREVRAVEVEQVAAGNEAPGLAVVTARVYGGVERAPEVAAGRGLPGGRDVEVGVPVRVLAALADADAAHAPALRTLHATCLEVRPLRPTRFALPLAAHVHTRRLPCGRQKLPASGRPPDVSDHEPICTLCENVPDMSPATDERRDTAREFAAQFADQSLEAAADVLSEGGTETVIDSYPEGFQRGEMNAVDVLEQYWYGLYGQYGDFESVAEVAADEEAVTAELSFAHGSHSLALAVEDGAITDFALPSEYEPPSYADPDTFEERGVTVDAGDVELEGVLTVPDGDGPFPGVVLVHGEGLHDTDGTAGNSKILKDFAWGLASDGAVVLRYEKRLNVEDTDPESFTFDDVVVDDAVAAVDELAAVDVVDADSLFVVGHSQGSWAAPRVADYHGSVAGVVALDGRPDPSPDPDDDFDFLKYSIEPDGDLSEEQEEELAAAREPFERLAAGEYEPDEELLGKPGRWHDSLADCNAAERIEAIDAPAFVAKTGRADPDVQPDIVEMQEETLAVWRGTDLGEDGRLEFYEDVGHYFQEGYEPTSMAHLYFADNVEAYVVADVADWVHDVANA